jgi:hypothetical protein
MEHWTMLAIRKVLFVGEREIHVETFGGSTCTFSKNAIAEAGKYREGQVNVTMYVTQAAAKERGVQK